MQGVISELPFAKMQCEGLFLAVLSYDFKTYSDAYGMRRRKGGLPLPLPFTLPALQIIVMALTLISGGT